MSRCAEPFFAQTRDRAVESMHYPNRDEVVRVMEAEAVYVAVDETRKPIPIKD